jgi:hypothetical protein
MVNDKKPVIKTGEIFTNKKRTYFFENDKNGNCIFSIDGSNDPITRIFAVEYDSLNRVAKLYSAHSNLGLSISENEYLKDKIIHYDYSFESKNPNDWESLNEIHSQKEFLEMPGLKELMNGLKIKTSIEILDSMKNIEIEYYLSENGDTTSINFYKYNKNNDQIFFHYGTLGSEEWTWDIYSIYDNNNNLIENFRISTEDGIKDTSEVRKYFYDDSNKLISEKYDYKNQFRTKTVYLYNKKMNVYKELFFEDEPFKIDIITKFKCYKKGIPMKEITKDYRNPRNERKEVRTFTLTYW